MAELTHGAFSSGPVPSRKRVKTKNLGPFRFRNGRRSRGGIMDFEPSARSEQWRKRLQSFFDSEVLPRHRAWLEHTAKREAAPFMGELQQKARAAGLWNLG